MNTAAIKKNHYCKAIKRDLVLYCMLLIPFAIVIVFKYVPIFSLIISFENYNFVDGVLGSEWVGFKWFKTFVSYRQFSTILFNTLKVSLGTLVFGFPAPIIFALMLNEVSNGHFKKIVQTVSYLPYFVSTVIVIGMMNQLLSPTTGVVNDIIEALIGRKVLFQTEPQYFRPMYVVSGIWSQLGYNAILYLSALSGISPELYEVAEVDGAGRWGKMWHVTLPGILPTIMVLFLMRMGSLLSIGFEKAYLMQNDLNIKASEIIGTYVYKEGILNMNYSYSSSVDVCQSILNLTLISTFNAISRKISEVSLW